MVKAPCCEKIGLKRGKWTIEEDELLVKYIQANGKGSWRSLPKNAGLLRCGKSCRLRWTNYLRPDLKRGKFTAEEDETIVKLHSSLGNRWSLIAQHLPGRTDNEIKNYWNSNLLRRIYSFRNLKEIKATINVPKMAVDGDCDESSRKRDTTTRSKGGSLCPDSRGDTTLSEGGSIEFLLPEDNILCLGSKEGVTGSEGDSTESLLSENYTLDIGSIRKSNSSCPGGKDDVTWSRECPIESLLLENIKINSCPGGMDNTTWSEENSIESLSLDNYVVDLGSNEKINSQCPKNTCNATWSEGGSIESFLLENYIVDIGSNRETNSSCLGWSDETMRMDEGGSIEYLLTENYAVDIGFNREANSSCHGSKDGAMWSEEGSSVESSLTKNYIIDNLEFLTQSLPHEMKGLAMQQHARKEEEVCDGIWSTGEQEQHIQGPHEQNEGNEIVLQKQHNECLYNFDNNWCDINFDYFLEEEYGVWSH